MLPRSSILSALILLPALAGVAQSPANLRHFGRNITVATGQTVKQVRCFLCSAEIEGHSTGNVHVYAGNVLLNGPVDGNVVVFGGNVTLAGGAAIGGHLFIFGGHLHPNPPGDLPAMTHPPTVISALVFLPVILFVCLTIGGLIVLTRRMVRGPVAYPPLPRL
jgi:hypothetical protein